MSLKPAQIQREGNRTHGIGNLIMDTLGNYKVRVGTANQSRPCSSSKNLGFYVVSNGKSWKHFLYRRVMIRLRF